ncbi:MAG: hypothetical protein EXR72_12365 [Myxococcales bacterium]|nr:hypothetical protein [Myxococcales bacterium]
MSPLRTPRRRQRGFSLIVVFLLITLMVGVAAMVMLSSQSDLQIAGQDRESMTAFHAAEAGVAFAKDWLASKAPTPGPTAFSVLLKSAAPELCQTGANVYLPGVKPNRPAQAYDTARGSSFQFCIHNNPLDPAYPGGTGHLDDTDGAVAIEAYGFGPGGAVSRITVEVQAASTSNHPAAPGVGAASGVRFPTTVWSEP